jgi:[acyl-carrier-protein] S-malonyltransferase
MTTPIKLAVFFPGQGSQSVGMLDALAESRAIVGQTFEEASDVLGRDLWALVHAGPKDALNETQNTQPAMLAAGIAVWRVWQAEGGPAASSMAGHSLGEYSALVAAGAMTFAEGIALAADRARLMQEAVPLGTGSMAAILGLDDDQVASVCAEQAQGAVLEPVNFNAPGQVVIAGERAAVERATAAAKAAGAKRALVLPVSVPSHCALMRPAAERLAERIQGAALRLPEVPVIHNVDCAVAESVDGLVQRLVAQLYSPVRWVQTVQAAVADGVTLALECGPGKVLTGLNKRIDKKLITLPVLDPGTLEKALAAAQEHKSNA